MKKLFTFIVAVFLCASCVTLTVPPGQAKKVSNPPPGQAKKASGSKSAAPYAPGQQKKASGKKK